MASEVPTDLITIFTSLLIDTSRLKLKVKRLPLVKSLQISPKAYVLFHIYSVYTSTIFQSILIAKLHYSPTTLCSTLLVLPTTLPQKNFNRRSTSTIGNLRSALSKLQQWCFHINPPLISFNPKSKKWALSGLLPASMKYLVVEVDKKTKFLLTHKLHSQQSCQTLYANPMLSCPTLNVKPNVSSIKPIFGPSSHTHRPSRPPKYLPIADLSLKALINFSKPNHRSTVVCE